MFHAHIALALELLTMAVSSLLILYCCKVRYVEHCMHKYTGDDQNPNTTRTDDNKKHKTHGHLTFFKIVGYFVLILSFAGWVCTSVSMFKYWSHYENMPSVNRTTNKLYDEDYKLPAYDRRDRDTMTPPTGTGTNTPGTTSGTTSGGAGTTGTTGTP